MIPSLIAGAVALAIVLFFLLRARDAVRAGRTPEGRNSDPPRLGKTETGPVPGTCALCGTRLVGGESMKSDILPGEGDRLMRIYGCPHCLGEEAGRKPRFCPVCGTGLGPGDHAIARYFERPGRRHVHILGCTICRKSPKEAWHGR